MNAKRLIAGTLLGLGLAILAAQSNAAAKHSNPPVKKGGAMDTNSLKPFGLSAQDLPKAKVFLAGYSPKTGAGKERIEILGTGEVRLVRSDNYEAPEEVVSAKIKPTDVAALLTLIESEGFLQMEREYKGNSVYSMRSHISLSLPSGEKSVFADNIAAPPAFERMVGAIKALAGMASPLALNHQYFFRL
jgi:hypothetical protein